MAIDKELKGYARGCIRLARLTDDPTIRGPLLNMAREWLEAAAAQPPRATRAARSRASKPPPRMVWGAPQCEGPGEVVTGA